MPVITVFASLDTFVTCASCASCPLHLMQPRPQIPLHLLRFVWKFHLIRTPVLSVGPALLICQLELFEWQHRDCRWAYRDMGLMRMPLAGLGASYCGIRSLWYCFVFCPQHWHPCVSSASLPHNECQQLVAERWNRIPPAPYDRRFVIGTSFPRHCGCPFILGLTMGGCAESGAIVLITRIPLHPFPSAVVLVPVGC